MFHSNFLVLKVVEEVFFNKKPIEGPLTPLPPHTPMDVLFNKQHSKTLMWVFSFICSRNLNDGDS